MNAYEITLGAHGSASKVIENGIDISGELTGIEIRCFVGQFTEVVLHRSRVEAVVGTVEQPDEGEVR